MNGKVLDDLHVDVDAVGDRAVVVVSGVLDMNSAVLFGGVLDAVVDADFLHPVVDVGEVTFVDAAALRVIVRVSLRLRELTGSLTLRSASDRVRRVLDVTGVSDLVVYAALDAVGAATVGGERLGRGGSRYRSGGSEFAREIAVEHRDGGRRAPARHRLGRDDG